nr:EOG090X0QLW [Lepidurus arcticus]
MNLVLFLVTFCLLRQGGFSGAKDPDDIYIDASGDDAGYDDEDTPSPPRVDTLQSRNNKPISKTTTTTTTTTTTRAPPPSTPPTQPPPPPVQPDEFEDDLDQDGSGSGAGIDVDGEEDEDDNITDIDDNTDSLDYTSLIDDPKKKEERKPLPEVGEPRKPQTTPKPQLPEDIDNEENEIVVDTPSRTPEIVDGGSVSEKEENNLNNDVHILGRKHEDRPTSFFAQPGVLAAVIGGAVVGLLCAILLVMFIVYRMRKKDEGSYVLDEPKRSPTSNSYSKNSREFYA